MTTNILVALQITLVGMAIVFAAIILIWMLISAITSFRPQEKIDPDQAEETNRKQKAAALAVAQAIMEKQLKQSRNYQLPPTAIVSAWQLSMRTNQMKKNRKLND